MSSAHAEYLAALQLRDSVEKANKPIFDAYTSLADRSTIVAKTQDTAATPPTSPTSSPSTITTLQTALTAAQQARTSLQSHLADLTASHTLLQSQSRGQVAQLATLTANASVLTQKLKDRDHELQAKGKLLQDVHDEVMSLTIQLNMAEQKVERLEKDNRELVARWMERVGLEVDQMNRGAGF